MITKNIKAVTIIITFTLVLFFVFLSLESLISSPEENDIDQNDISQINDNPYIKGFIFDITDERILVVENINGDGDDYFDFSGNAIWLRVNDDFNNLETGQKVEAWVTGPVLESYPAQGEASKILIIEETICYVGGCSGELCTDNPEAISTCEFLPGMECIKEGMTCQLVEGNCSWVMSQEAVNCFLNLINEHGPEVKNSRIGHLFEKAEDF